MKVVAVLQARTTSTRLPGKVLAQIQGRPMLELMLERVRRAELIDQVIVATSTGKSDNALENLCKHLGVECYRGSLDNVLQRFRGAVRKYGGDHVVRLTGDCPLIDSGVIDATIRFYLDGGYDYASNTMPPTFPDGLDVEVFSRQALESTFEKAGTALELEHVTPHMRNHPETFKLGGFQGSRDLSRLRWTVDEPEDLEFVRAVYDALYEKKESFGYLDVLELMEQNEELGQLNNMFSRNEGMRKNQKEGSNG